MNFWDERYSAQEYIYGTEPNNFFKEVLLAEKQTLNILLPADGEGRNAVFAAKQGHHVTAFDYSVEAQKKAELLAKSSGVNINYYISSYQSFKVQQKYDLIALIFTHLEIPERNLLFSKLIESLSPNGKLIFEVFAKEQLNYTSGGPKQENMLYSLQEMRTLFKDLNIVYLEQKEIELNEGKYHLGVGSVIRGIFSKSANT